MEKRYPFSMPLRVCEYDCNAAGGLRASAALRYCQEVAGAQLEALGLGFARLQEEGVFFVLIGQGLRFQRPPRAGEAIVAATAPAAAKGARLYRETVLLDARGGLLVESQSAWALLDCKTGHPLRYTALGHELPMLAGDWTPFVDPARLKFPAAGEDCPPRTVRRSDLDGNLHMNNTVYADVALDCFPELDTHQGFSEVLLHYRRQARLGETICLKRGREGAVLTVEGFVGEEACFCASFALANQKEAPIF